VTFDMPKGYLEAIKKAGIKKRDLANPMVA
jgi:hypothetical protein